MQRAFGDRFILLTPTNLNRYVDFDFSEKIFFFARSTDRKKDSISLITAKSDFIRFRFIQENGGFWLDADTLVLGDFTPEVGPLMKQGKLAWHSEAIFGAYACNSIVRKAAEAMIASHRQKFGNPGGIKDFLKECSEDKISVIPRWLHDPTLDRSYRNTDWSKTTRDDIEASDFIENPSCKIVKIFNSNLQGVDMSRMSVEDFFASNTLMSKLFLHVEPSVDYWIKAASEVNRYVSLAAAK